MNSEVHLPKDLLDALSNKSLEQINNIISTLKGDKKLITLIGNKRVNVEKPILHEYHCEMCSIVETYTHYVTLSLTNSENEKFYKKPLKLDYICNNCQKAIIIGIALALKIREVTI